MQIRQIITDLLTPHAQRSLDNENKINILLEENESLRRKVDEVEFIFQKQVRKTVKAEDLQKQIVSVEQEQRTSY
jgi:hypothetical protein